MVSGRINAESLHGMILAAGFGTRLMPFSKFMPKPLFPVLGNPVIRHQAELLLEAGITDAVINLHHLGYQVQKYFSDNNLFGLTVEYTLEKKILGTGGGINNARHLFGNRTVVVLNGDTMLFFNLQKLITHHFNTGGAATMLLRVSPNTPEENSIYIDSRGKVRRMVGFGEDSRGLLKCAFLGAHVLSNQIQDYMPPDGCIIRKGYTNAVKDGKEIFGLLCDAEYLDIGTPKSLLDANLKMLSKTGNNTFAGKNCLFEGESVLDDGTILSGDNRIGTGAKIRQTLVLTGETINAGEILSGEIAGFGLRVKV